MARKYSITDSVFINCVFFEPEFNLLFRSYVFTIFRCGFMPRCALEQNNATTIRLFKILEIIKECRYSINDISWIKLNENGKPRFNMPFELGLIWGAKYFGDEAQKEKSTLIFCNEPFDYQQYISDLNGIDACPHKKDYKRAIRCIREFLNDESERKTIPASRQVIQEFELFVKKLPIILEDLNLEDDELSFNDLSRIIEEYIAYNLKVV